MSIFPTTRQDHWKLVLTGLGAYIIGVPAVGIMSRMLARVAGWTDLGQWRYGAESALQMEDAQRYTILGWGYIACLVALFVLNPVFQDRITRRAALAIWVFGLAFLVLFIYPMTQVVKVR